MDSSLPFDLPIDEPPFMSVAPKDALLPSDKYSKGKQVDDYDEAAKVWNDAVHIRGRKGEHYTML